MELLNISPTPILPRTMFVAYRALDRTPDLTRAELVEAISPDVIEAPQGGSHAKRAVDALVKFEWVREPDAEATLELLVERGMSSAAFVRRLRRTILGPLEDSPEDFLRGVAWMLGRSPNEPQTFVSALQERPPVFVNDIRWNTFLPWATALGFAREWPLGDGGLSVDPTVALRDAIEFPSVATFAPGSKIELAQLIRQLGVELPLISSVIDSEKGDDERLPRSIAFALRSLSVLGVISMERQADAPSMVKFPAGAGAKEEAMYSHVTIQGAR